MRRATRAARAWMASALTAVYLAVAPHPSLGPAAAPASLGDLVRIAPAHRAPAPDFTLLDLRGGTKSLRDYRGKVVLLTFWASLCLPCRQEMPSIREAYERHRAAGFEVIGISIDARPADAGAFVADFGLPFLNLLDPDVRVGQEYHALDVPTSFLVDRTGRIAYKVVGPRDWMDATSQEAILELLRER